MTVWTFTTCYWRSAEHAAQKAPELQAWVKRVRFHFQPQRLFIATGANPEHNPVASDAECCPSGIPQTKSYDVVRWCYYLCDVEAMLRLVISVGECDLLVALETDWIIRGFKAQSLLREFLNRQELICAPRWYNGVENSFVVWKPDGMKRFLSNRLRQNLVTHDKPVMLAEDEMASIFRGSWWNPWPRIVRMRQEFGIPHETVTPDEIAKCWPLVGRPSPEIKALEVL